MHSRMSNFEAMLRKIFPSGSVWTVRQDGENFVVTDTHREVWCTRTAIRNHANVLDLIFKTPKDYTREWTRDGYVIAVDRPLPQNSGVSPTSVIRRISI